MPTERFAMRHVRDVIRLKSAGMPTREMRGGLGSTSPRGGDGGLAAV